jgi:acetyl-CoA decarbonylase/synthase complex subunit beta
MASRNTIWIRLSKEAFKKGLNSFNYIGKVIQRLYKAEFPIVEKIQTTFITDEEKMKEHLKTAMKVYEERDARIRGMKDEDVEEFYGCILCQSFAPTHVCIITPNRPSLCGAISWFDARAAVRINPKGHNFKVEKGECLDPIKAEYSKVNEIAREKSLGAIKRVSLYSMFENPHTSCGCFEALAFYIPEVDGVGIVHREFKGPTVNGMPFSTMAGQAGGGKQIEGLIGVSVQYMKSPKFLQADGGWNRVVWIPSDLKERLEEAIPSELYPNIATEKDAKDVEELKAFLQQKGHPVVKKVKEEITAECSACGKTFTIRPPIPKRVECPHCKSILERAE